MIDHIYVFSYNRGCFLDNCVRSIERNFQLTKITIVDDHSDDIETTEYLKHLGTTYRIVSPHAKEEKTSTYGNLYKNKNWVMNEAKRSNYQNIMMIPEDHQIVRPLLASDGKRIQKLFDSTENIFQCLPFFIEKVYKFAGIQEKLQLLRHTGFFVKRQGVDFKRSNYSDFGIINVDKFFKLLGTYQENEYQTEQACINKNIVAAFDSYPCLTSLPFNTYNRIQGDNKLTELINSITKTGFYPYHDMTDLEIRDLFNKPDSEMAFAEDWLNCPNVPNKNLWAFWGGFFNLEVYDDDRRHLAHRLQYIKEANFDDSTKHKLMIQECERYLENDTSNGKNTSYSYH